MLRRLSVSLTGKSSLTSSGDPEVDKFLKESDGVIDSLNELFPQEGGLLRGVLKTGLNIIKRSGSKKKQRDPSTEYLQLKPQVQRVGEFFTNEPVCRLSHFGFLPASPLPAF